MQDVPIEDFLQMQMVLVMKVKHLLNLVGTELDELDDRLVGVEGAKDAIVAKVDDAMVMSRHAAQYGEGIGVILRRISPDLFMKGRS